MKRVCLTIAFLLLLACGRPAAPERLTLPNGLRVQLVAEKSAPNTAVVVVFDAGGDEDPAGRSGMAHLLEHVLFTAAAGGTKARSAAEVMQAYPAGWNAQTGDAYTVLATVVPNAALEGELRASAARIGALRITAEDLDREKPRLAEEVENMFGGIPAIAASNLAREEVLPSPNSGRKGGLAAEVAPITAEDLAGAMKDRYTASGAHLVLAGGFDRTQARTWIEREFGALPLGSPAPARSVSGSSDRSAAAPVRVVAVTPRMPLTRPLVSLAYRAPAPGDGRYPAFLVLAARLGTRVPPAANTMPPFAYAVLDDPAVAFFNGSVESGETPESAVARLDGKVTAIVSETLTRADIAAARNFYGPMVGASPMPAMMLKLNPYGAAFSLARREQMGIDGVALAAAWKSMDDESLREAAAAFAPERRAAVVVTDGTVTRP